MYHTEMYMGMVTETITVPECDEDRRKFEIGIAQ